MKDRAKDIQIPWVWPISRFAGSSMAICLGFEVYGDKAPLIVKNFFHKIVLPCREAKYWALYRFHPRYKYHILKIGEPGYTDYDYRMLHACMNILELYLYEEYGKSNIQSWVKKNCENSPEGGIHDHGDWDEHLQIYRWWKITKPSDEKRQSFLVSHLYRHGRMYTEPVEGNDRLVEVKFKPWEGLDKGLHAELDKLREKIEQDEQDYLVRLVKIRRTLWT